MLLSYLLLLALVPASLAGYPDNLPKRSVLDSRQTNPSDPCCKSCGAVVASQVGCGPTSDIFCGCDGWVASAPACEACIYNVGFNTTYAVNPGPSLELFWAWCQCQKPCHTTADAVFGTLCGGGQNVTCKSEYIARDGPACECCLKKVDPWFAGVFAVWIAEAKEYLKSGTLDYPGMHTSQLADLTNDT